MEFNKNRTQVWLDAPSKQVLVFRMSELINNNLKAYNFSTPMRDGKVWITWYYADISRDMTWDKKPLISILKGAK